MARSATNRVAGRMQKTAVSRYSAGYLRTASRPKPERVGRSRRIAWMHL